MEEAVFQRELQRFRKVRDRDWVAHHHGASGGSSARAPAAPRLPSAGDAAAAPSKRAPPEAALVYKDFWGGLDAVLSLHWPREQDRKRVAAAFDELHYAALREMNLEDIDDVAAMTARELGAPVR